MYRECKEQMTINTFLSRDNFCLVTIDVNDENNSMRIYVRDISTNDEYVCVINNEIVFGDYVIGSSQYIDKNINDTEPVINLLNAWTKTYEHLSTFFYGSFIYKCEIRFNQMVKECHLLLSKLDSIEKQIVQYFWDGDMKRKDRIDFILIGNITERMSREIYRKSSKTEKSIIKLENKLRDCENQILKLNEIVEENNMNNKCKHKSEKKIYFI